MSATVLATVTLIAAEVAVLPAASRATAVRVWLPLEASVILALEHERHNVRKVVGVGALKVVDFGLHVAPGQREYLRRRSYAPCGYPPWSQATPGMGKVQRRCQAQLQAMCAELQGS